MIDETVRALPAPRARRLALRAAAARGGLATVLAAGAWLALASASGDWIVDTSSAPEPHWLRGPLAGLLPSLTNASFSGLLILMLAGYVLAVAGGDAVPERTALTVSALLVVLFGLAPVVLSSDLFGYVAYARLDVLHHLNPYIHPALAAPHDAVYPFVYWTDSTSPYGPLYTLLTLPLGGADLPVAVWGLKTLSTVACLSGLALIARAAPLYERRAGQAVLLVGANPLLLAYGVGGGHNDLVVLAPVAGALALLAPGRPDRRSGATAAGAGATLVLASALKATGGLLLPFALAASGARRRFAAGALAAGAAASTLAAVAFGPGLPSTIGQIATSAEYVADFSGPDAVGRLLATGVTLGVRLACAGAALIVVAVMLRRAWRGGDWLVCAALSEVAILCAIPSLAPWYVAWVLPVAALARGRAPRVGIVLITVVVTFTHLPILGFAGY